MEVSKHACSIISGDTTIKNRSFFSYLSAAYYAFIDRDTNDPVWDGLEERAVDVYPFLKMEFMTPTDEASDSIIDIFSWNL